MNPTKIRAHIMKLSLQAKLVAATLLVTVLVSAILTVLSFNQLKASSESSIATEASAQSKAFTKYLSSWTSSRQSAMNATKIALEQALSTGLDKKEILKILNHGRASVDFSMTFIGMEDGLMIRNTNIDKEGYDPRVRGWYKQARSENKSVISKPFISATAKKMAITFATPILVNSKLVGVVGGLVYMDEILNSVLDLKVQGDGYAVLLDKKSNLVVAHPNEALILKEISVLNSSLDALLMQSSLADIEMSGQDSKVYFNGIDGTNWVIGLVMQNSILSQPVDRLLINILLVVAGLLILTTFSVVFLIRWLFNDLKKVSAGLGDIAKGNGDLTLRINANDYDEIGLLANNFNSFVEYLHGIISRVKDVSDELDIQAATTARHAVSSADKVKVQQDEIAMVATAVNEMTIATQEIAANAVNTASTADEAVTLSSEGQSQVRKSQSSINALADEVTQVSEVITELDKHAQEISSILATISGIAEQTNLLALNAAIEAARAGEQGRGFAVVADEVRVLSQRTHSSTEEIQNMIEVLQKTTQNAVNSMEASQLLTSTSVSDAEIASESLSRIRDSITTINDMSTLIATAAEEQTSVTLEINSNTTNINSAAEDLAQEAQESTVRSHKLSQLTEALKSDIGKFKL
jgi:methyl-accepting chemotaxis protein